MLITFNYYNAYGKLPESEILFDFTRRIHGLMTESPYENWRRIKQWARPMNQLPCGIFLNLTGCDFNEFAESIDANGKKNEEIRIEQSWISKGYIRHKFHVQGNTNLHDKI